VSIKHGELIRRIAYKQHKPIAAVLRDIIDPKASEL
jgi:hypothetical protein